MAVGTLFVVFVLEALETERLRSAGCGDGVGEIDLSEAVEDTGDALPPQPKKV